MGRLTPPYGRLERFHFLRMNVIPPLAYLAVGEWLPRQEWWEINGRILSPEDAWAAQYRYVCAIPPPEKLLWAELFS